jgi:hypothetical protein
MRRGAENKEVPRGFYPYNGAVTDRIPILLFIAHHTLALGLLGLDARNIPGQACKISTGESENAQHPLGQTTRSYHIGHESLLGHLLFIPHLPENGSPVKGIAHGS